MPSSLLKLTPTQRGGLVRGVLTASPRNLLAVSDFSGIEARVLAWLADDTDALEMFRNNGDPYIRAAANIFGVPPEEISKDDPRRQLGKTAELGLGYQMGHRKFEQNAGAENLKRAGVTAYQVVKAWRELRAPVCEFWDELHRQWKLSYGYFSDYDDGTRRMALPSGREIVYRDAGYDGYVGRGGRVVRTYGGLLTENLVQAASRDLLAAALVKAEDEGLRPVMHVHDEIVCDVPAAEAEHVLHRLESIMSEAEAPAWAAGCPIKAEGYVAFRYRK